MLSFNRKYSFIFNFCKSGELFVLLLIIALASFSRFGNIVGIFGTILCIVLFVLWMIYSKIRANGTNISFFETKLIYTSKYLFFDKEVIIEYDDILNIAYFKAFSQKINNSGSIRFYTKGFLQGLTFTDVPDFKQNLVAIEKIATEKCKNVHSIGYIR